jgi:hypothetical protein
VFIEFKLPQDESYGYVLNLIKVEIVDWATRYNVPYTQKTIKYTHRLGFNKEEYFSLFSMTWQSGKADCPSWLNYQIINIANERY